MVEKFKEYLTHSNMAKNTVSAYIYAVNDFNSKYKELTKKNLLLYKTYLIETFKPKTVNLRIQALNKYLEYLRKPRLRLKSVKVQQRNYLENVTFIPTSLCQELPRKVQRHIPACRPDGA